VISLFCWAEVNVGVGVVRVERSGVGVDDRERKCLCIVIILIFRVVALSRILNMIISLEMQFLKIKLSFS